MISSRRRSRRPWWWSALVLAVVLAAAGCSGDDDPTDAGSGSTASDAATATDEGDGGDGDDGGTGDDEEPGASTIVDQLPGIDPNDGPEVVLIDPGAEPRMELRLQIETPRTETILMTQRQEITQTIDGEPLPSTGPVTLAFVTEVTTTEAGPGFYQSTSVVTDVTVGDDVDPEIADLLSANLDSVIGVTTESVIDDRGRVLLSELSGFEGVDPATGATIEQMATSEQIASPLPIEPVGVGARWEVIQTIPGPGLEIVQTMRYELVDIDGTELTMTVDVEQSVDEGTVLSTNGVDATVLSWSGGSTNAVTTDLAALVPTSVAEGTIVQELGFGPGAESTVLLQEVDTTITIEPG